MEIIDIILLFFIVMEGTNVIILYRKPDFPYGNGVGVFNHWHKAQEEEDSKLFITYLVNWVANCKLIFIALLVVILATGSTFTKTVAVAVMIPAVAAYFLTLHPLIKALDNKGHITPKGYSKALFGMITGFIVCFVVALVSSLVL